MKRSFGLKPSNIPSKEYRFYDIPNINEVKLAVYIHKTYTSIGKLCAKICKSKFSIYIGLGETTPTKVRNHSKITKTFLQ